MKANYLLTGSLSFDFISIFPKDSLKEVLQKYVYRAGLREIMPFVLRNTKTTVPTRRASSFPRGHGSEVEMAMGLVEPTDQDSHAQDPNSDTQFVSAITYSNTRCPL